MDHLKRRTLSLDNVSMVVLDEADQMLDMGFRDDIERILKRVPQKRQTLLFSATMPQPIIEISKRFQNKPEFVRVDVPGTHRSRHRAVLYRGEGPGQVSSLSAG